MIVTSTLKPDEKLTDEEIEMLERAKQMPITFDDDCPETTPDMAKQFLCAARMRNRLLATREKNRHSE